MNRDDFKQNIKRYLQLEFGKRLENATKSELYFAISRSVRNLFVEQWLNQEEDNFKKGKRQAYYLSAEFLMGRFFSNNMINFEIHDEIKSALEELDININAIEDQEVDAALGNGGLGRLAACFLDSAATHALPLHGYGIRYQFGIFTQDIENGFQVEHPNLWLKHGNPWEIRRFDEAIEVRFGGRVAVSFRSGEAHFNQQDYETVTAVPYDYPVIGFGGKLINTLRLWSAEPKNPFDLALFNNGQYQDSVLDRNRAENISKVLYPNDNHPQGKELRLRQQYFFVSASIQDCIRKFKRYVNGPITDLPQYFSFQLNDTHPVVAIPELMRILLDHEKLDWEDAWAIVNECFAYTNHTILEEALEKWPIDMFRRTLPRIYQIIEEVNRRLSLQLQIKYPADSNKTSAMSILGSGVVRMAWLGIVGSHSVNGVAALHTQILKNQVLNQWYQYYPNKFNNKTNGVTQRRWLLKSNPALAELISSKIGTGWITELSELKKLTEFADDKTFQKTFRDIKRANKIRLAKHIEVEHGIKVNIDSIFDVQVKRLHEYKRQLMNVLHIIHLYGKIKANPNLEVVPRTFIFGAKAASGYYRAKLIIKLINNLSEIINNDSDVGDKLKVFFLKNYNVSLAEDIFPASDVSEQISTASKEASGTGNMKFMMNGALTLGTLDGANIEIVEEVGNDYAFIFGLHSDEVTEYYANGGYNPWDIYNNDANVRYVMDQLKENAFCKEHPGLFDDIWNSLMYGADGGRADTYFVLKDFDSYRKAQEDIDTRYKDTAWWTKAAILNVASSGKFSSDRTIKEYASEIWDIKPV